MGAERASKAQLFNAAAELAHPAERAAFLDAACAGDPELRVEIEDLLRRDHDAHSFLESPPAVLLAITAPLDTVEQPGTVIGPYKLLDQIGEGGFGVVFLAEQERPVKRRVALKVIKPGMDTRQVIARFEAERQALAMMDHPNIAKVLDAGATDDRSKLDAQARGGEGEAGRGGELNVQATFRVSPSPPLPFSPSASTGRPFFVMELVQGVPITEYCDQCNLTTRERLELFITVCQAVQHAHQKGVIHRDIKPTNVLVAMQDGRPAPKIIDFGVAKAIGQRLTENTLTTAFAQMVGTPLYMSPEQAELSPLGVDTRSDIYSLGVLLYELLTGMTPFDKDRLHAASYDELRRIIREEEPLRPSARISTLAANLATTVAEHRRTEPRRLRQTVGGDLDWIVMKCLEKDRNRRYDSAGSLARDIDCYLHDEPVQACPPSAGYRFKKFIRRNKVAAAFIALLMISVTGLGVSNVAIKRERDAKTTALARAQAVSDLLQEMLGSADAEQAKGSQYTVRELLDDFSAGLGSQLADAPEAEADIHATIGRAYRSLQVPNKARPHLERAIELTRQLDGPQSEKLAAILVDYALNLQNQGRYFEAESQLRQSLEIYRQLGVSGSPVIYALRILQHVLISDNRHGDAESVTEEAMAIASHSGEEFPDLASMLHRYADMKIWQGRPKQGEELARQAVDMHRRLHGEQHPETAYGLRTLANALQQQQKLEGAETALRECLAIFRRCFPEEQFAVRTTVDQLKTVLKVRGDQSALDALAEEEAKLPIRSDNPGDHVRLAGLLMTNNLNVKSDEAHRLIQRAIEAYGQVAADYPDDFDRRRKAAEGYVLGVIKLCAANPDFASEVDEVNRRLVSELAAMLAAFPASSECQWQVAMIYRGWAEELFPYTVHLPTTERAYREAIQLLKNLTPAIPQPPVVQTYLAGTYVYLGDVLVRTNRPEAAEAVFRRATDIYDQLAADHAVVFPQESLVGCAKFAHFLATTHRQKEAEAFIHKAVLAAERGLDTSVSADYLRILALVQLRLGDEAGYRETCAALVRAAGTDSADIVRVALPWTYGLGPHALEDLSLPLKYAEENIARNPFDAPYLNLAVLGGVQYRAGQYERAASNLKKSIGEYPSHPPTGVGTVLFPKLLLAMTKWQLGQRDEARRLFAEAQPAINESLQTPSTYFQRRVALEVLSREAEALIEPKEGDEAVETDYATPTTPSTNDK
jgi:serine/threonine protein kinase